MTTPDEGRTQGAPADQSDRNVLLEGNTAVITAGGNGIGRSVALAFAAHGLNVVIADLDGAAAVRVADEIGRGGGAALGLAANVRDESSLEAVRDEALRRFGRVDLLMNHAGTSVNGPVERIPLGEWEQLIDLNILGMIRGLRVFLPAMMEAGRGHVVFTTSSLALLGGHPHAASAVPYITTKGAVISLAQSTRMYLDGHGIGVTLFAPEYTATSFPKSVRHVGVDPNAAPVDVASAVPYAAQTPDQAAVVLIKALRYGRFLAAATPGVDSFLVAQAEAQLDPTALTDRYYALGLPGD